MWGLESQTLNYFKYLDYIKEKQGSSEAVSKKKFEKIKKNHEG